MLSGHLLLSLPSLGFDWGLYCSPFPNLPLASYRRASLYIPVHVSARGVRIWCSEHGRPSQGGCVAEGRKVRDKEDRYRKMEGGA